MGGSEIRVNLFTGGEIRDKWVAGLKTAGLKNHTCDCEEGRDSVVVTLSWL